MRDETLDAERRRAERERWRELQACRRDPRQIWIEAVRAMHATRRAHHALAWMTTRQMARRIGA